MAGATMQKVRAGAVLLARDEAVRETIATILRDLSDMPLTIVDSVDAARRLVLDSASTVLVVAPAFRDGAASALLRELRPASAPVVVVSASVEDSEDAGIFVHAPFDVDTLLDAVDTALRMHPASGVHRIAR